MTEKKTIKALEEAYRAVFQHLLVHKRKPTISQERSLQQRMQAITMVGNKSLGASIMGRIIGRAKIVTITGPDIRLMDPAQKPKDLL